MIQINLNNLNRVKLKAAHVGFRRVKLTGGYQDPCIIGVLVPHASRKALDRQSCKGLGALFAKGAVMIPQDQVKDAIDLQVAYDNRRWDIVESIAARWIGEKE